MAGLDRYEASSATHNKAGFYTFFMSVISGNSAYTPNDVRDDSSLRSHAVGDEERTPWATRRSRCSLRSHAVSDEYKHPRAATLGAATQHEGDMMILEGDVGKGL